ncbi:MAG: hypothetical protein A3D52_02145 [Candidatus Taylorbacteria bacterium RIFCSPHIGHO2_02_FULL_44_36]|uniref:Pilus assembly protein PilN n=1 Tax=Candidatus Taylorbacteria bacterium RIFCSPLOWO2_12_FULL_44_15c TaxID=1802333 RepID=A0A1G2P6S6_9BACT|nr:MAG: hypothetical protein A3D52_02145 [Candidatus Taylorbacteria bacterium RIFCSPHIGHO2_02_FULL_44_36]OHA38323.1 MAG: hypothetical protein A3I97_02270 [Candidatus Taylorbacteria bacterium RIFCSPLOWO2_02_FULL_44_35]OHA44045.1 MAG: hypothetical protein A3G03_00625 [Candidatus Taylorbacteria bacterium RIFCSPLOWO2_12_FULL_44_15c]
MKNNRSKIFLFVLVAAAAVTAAAAYVWFWRSASAANDETSYIRGDIESQLKKNEITGALEKLVNDTETARRQIDSYFVGADQTVDFVEYLESLARAAGVNFTIVSLGVDQAKDDFKDQIILRGEVTGNWSPTMNFLSFLENAPYRLDLADVAITKPEKVDWETKILIKAFQLKK